MSKTDSNGNGAAHTSQVRVQFALQGKGGIDKSVIVSWLAELLMDWGQPVRCIDGDPVNRPLSHYKAFTVEELGLVNQDLVLQLTRNDSIIQRSTTNDVKPALDSGEHETATVTFERVLNTGETAALSKIHPKTLQKVAREGTVPRPPRTKSTQRTSRRNPPATTARESLIPMVLLAGCRVRFSTCIVVAGGRR